MAIGGNAMKMLITILMIVAATSLAFAQGKDELIQKGDELWLNRSESMDSVNKAIELWQKAAQLEPKDAEPSYKVAMGYYYLGRFTDDKQRKMELFTKGKEWGEEAVKRNPQSAGAHYWLAANLGKWAQAHGVMKSLKSKGEIESNLLEVKQIDPTYYYGGADRILGRMYYELPKILGGGKKKAEEHLRASLKIAPDYSMTLVFLAELLADSGRKDEAKTVLQKLMGSQAMPGFERELKDDQAEGKKLLEKLG